MNKELFKKNKKKIIAIILLLLIIASIVGFNSYRKYQEDQYLSASGILRSLAYNANLINKNQEHANMSDNKENIQKFMENPEQYIKADGTDGMFMMAQSFKFFTGREVDWQLMLQLIYEKKFTKVVYSSENSLYFKSWLSGGSNYYRNYVKQLNEVALANGIVLDTNTPYEEIEAFLSEHSEEIEEALAYKRQQYNEEFPPNSNFGYTTESDASSG